MNDPHHARNDPDSEPDKFAFGKNWANFLETVNDETVGAAGESMRSLLRVTDLKGKRFVDAGCGSGLFSLAAYNLGASVTSFDVDDDSVACAEHLRGQVEQPDRWTVVTGSLLDETFMTSVDGGDVVYCWGVAHHTGDMWKALELLCRLVEPDGKLVVAIYNDEQYISRLWHSVKRIYQRLPAPLRTLYALVIWFVLFLRRAMVTAAACAMRLVSFRNPITPISNWINESRTRGMHGWYDLVDWIGGWPFEVARPEEIFRFARDRGFELREMTTSGGHGCNEFMFERRQ